MTRREPNHQPDPIDRPWWFVTCGTVSFVVQAADEADAENRVRRDCFDRYATTGDIYRLPVIRHGEVVVRPATDEDRGRHDAIKDAMKARRP